MIRLIEMLLILVLEGRKALPKASQPSIARRFEGFPGDRTHRALIEAIRSGNNDEFFEAMESGKERERERERERGGGEGGRERERREREARGREGDRGT